MTSNGGAVGVLAYSEILRRLKAGEIFHEGTWVDKSIRAAAYDLRIANDFLIIAGTEAADTLVFPVGTIRTEHIDLRPGQLAYVSTTEKLLMPWDLVGQIGIKSSLVRRGLLILGGAFVDPGFGHDRTKETGERLHFTLMNIGGDDVPLFPGTTPIASLQFHPIIGEVPQGVRNRKVRGMEDAQLTHFSELPGVKPGSKLALGFFTELSKLRKEVSGIESSIKEFNEKLTDVRSGAAPMLTFGVAILGVTLLGVVFTSLMELAKNPALVSNVRGLSNAAGGGIGFLAIVLLACAVGCLAGWVIHEFAGLVKHAFSLLGPKPPPPSEKNLKS